MVRWLNRNENLSSSSPNCLRVGLRSSKSEEGYSSVAEKEMITMNMSTRYINYISLAVLLINGTAFDLMAQEEQYNKNIAKQNLVKISQNIDDQFSKDTRRDPFTLSEHLGVETQRQGSGIEFFHLMVRKSCRTSNCAVILGTKKKILWLFWMWKGKEFSWFARAIL